MRKLLLFCTLVFSVSITYAQQSDGEELLSKRGQPILPEAGHYSIGFDAVPFLDYLGNIFTGGGNTPPTAEFINQQIVGKYFLSDDQAIRVRARIDQEITSNRNRVILDNQSIPDDDIQVTDEQTQSVTDISIGGGLEFRRGTGRVVGVYGGEAALLIGRNSVSYEYGNPMTEVNQTPTSTFDRVRNGRYERPVEENNGKQIGFGVNGFAGVEYFVAPKLSLGAEFSWGINLIKNYSSQETYEFWNSSSGSRDTRTRTTGAGGNSVLFDTGNYGGSINLMFYF